MLRSRENCCVLRLNGNIEQILARIKQTHDLVVSVCVVRDESCLEECWNKFQPMYIIVTNPEVADTCSVVSRSPQWLMVAESGLACEEGVRSACNKASLLSCLADIITTACHREDLRCFPDGVPRFAVIEEASVPRGCWVLMLNPKYHDARDETCTRKTLANESSWVVWFVPPRFIHLGYESVGRFRDALVRNACVGPLAKDVARCVVTESTLFKSDGCKCDECASVPYWHTCRDLRNNSAPLLALEKSVRNWLLDLLGVDERAIKMFLHYPCGPIFTTLHVHVRINKPDDHELSTGRTWNMDLSPGSVFTPIDSVDSVSRAENCVRSAIDCVYRVEDSSGSFALIRSSDVPFAIFNGWACLTGSNLSHVKIWRSALCLDVEPSCRRWLVAVCGDSGSGKDTTIGLAQQNHAGTVLWPSLVVRGAEYDDAYLANRSRARVQSGDPSKFDLFWKSNGSEYGINLAVGVSVVNLSRSYLALIAKVLPPDARLVIVFLAVPSEITENRSIFFFFAVLFF
jgi:hypothetical protein